MPPVESWVEALLLGRDIDLLADVDRLDIINIAANPHQAIRHETQHGHQCHGHDADGDAKLDQREAQVAAPGTRADKVGFVTTSAGVTIRCMIPMLASGCTPIAIDRSCYDNTPESLCILVSFTLKSSPILRPT